MPGDDSDGGMGIWIIVAGAGAGVGILLCLGIAAYCRWKSSSKSFDHAEVWRNSAGNLNNLPNGQLQPYGDRPPPTVPARTELAGDPEISRMKTDLLFELKLGDEPNGRLSSEFDAAAAGQQQQEEAGARMARADSKNTRQSNGKRQIVSRVDSKPSTRYGRVESNRTSGGGERDLVRQDSKRSTPARDSKRMGRNDSRRTRESRGSNHLDRERRTSGRMRSSVEEPESGSSEDDDMLMEMDENYDPEPARPRRPSKTSSIAPSVYSTASQQASANKVHKWLKKTTAADQDGPP